MIFWRRRLTVVVVVVVWPPQIGIHITHSRVELANFRFYPAKIVRRDLLCDIDDWELWNDIDWYGYGIVAGSLVLGGFYGTTKQRQWIHIEWKVSLCYDSRSYYCFCLCLFSPIFWLTFGSNIKWRVGFGLIEQTYEQLKWVLHCISFFNFHWNVDRKKYVARMLFYVKLRRTRHTQIQSNTTE